MGILKPEEARKMLGLDNDEKQELESASVDATYRRYTLDRKQGDD